MPFDPHLLFMRHSPFRPDVLFGMYQKWKGRSLSHVVSYTLMRLFSTGKKPFPKKKKVPEVLKHSGVVVTETMVSNVWEQVRRHQQQHVRHP